MVKIVREVDSLEFDEYSEKVERALGTLEVTDRTNRLRIGVILTFSLCEPRDEKYIRYNVDELSNGSQLYLIRPGPQSWGGQTGPGYDFKLCVEDWDSSEQTAPGHDEIYDDLFWKREHDDSESFGNLCEAIFKVHEGINPNKVIDEYGDSFDFTVGRTPEVILKTASWMFIEQDINYWCADGREMTIGAVRNLNNGGEFSPEQDLDEIHQSTLAIQNY